MDKQFRDFFDRVHKIMGVDTDAARDEAAAKLERAIAVRFANCCLNAMGGEARQKYEAFVKAKPAPHEVAELVQTMLPADKIDNCTLESAQSVVHEYVASILKDATGEQKQQMGDALQALLSIFDPAALKKIVGKLSTPVS